jgi:hypothetical protein
LAKQCHDCPVTLRFGIFSNSSNDEFSKHNDLTIVWKKPEQSDYVDTRNVFKGTGNLTDGIKQSKLEDSNSQIEIIFYKNITTLCNNVTSYPVMGVPDTHVEIITGKERRQRSFWLGKVKCNKEKYHFNNNNNNK